MAISVLGNTSESMASDVSSTTNKDTSGANLIVVVASYFNASIDVTLSDSKSNTWNSLTRYLSGSMRIRTFYSLATSVGTGHNFTFAGAGVFASIGVLWASGAGGGVDSGKDSGASGTSTRSAGSLTPSEDNCLVVAGFEADVATSISIDGGFTAAVKNAGGQEANGIAYLVQTTATAANPSWTWSGGSTGVVNLAVFKSTAAATGQPTGRRTSLCGPAFNSPRQLRDGVIICEQKRELSKPSRKIFIPMAGGRAA